MSSTHQVNLTEYTMRDVTLVELNSQSDTYVTLVLFLLQRFKMSKLPCCDGIGVTSSEAMGEKQDMQALNNKLAYYIEWVGMKFIVSGDELCIKKVRWGVVLICLYDYTEITLAVINSHLANSFS